MKYITLSFLIISITINGLLGMPPLDKVETKHAAGRFINLNRFPLKLCLSLLACPSQLKICDIKSLLNFNV